VIREAASVMLGNVAYFTLRIFASLTWTQEYVLGPDITAEYAQTGRKWRTEYKLEKDAYQFELCEFPMIVKLLADFC
jgi:hypothetical protein